MTSYNWNVEEFYKEGNFYRGPEKQWELEKYGFYPRGLGDLIYNTLRVIIETDDKSEWVNDSFTQCVQLLRARKRWPDYMNKEWRSTYRSQFSMTRDPWILLYACAIHLGYNNFIKMKPPLRLYTPHIWAWRRALLDKPNLYCLYRRLLRKPKREFVRVLRYYQEWAYENK